MAGDAGARLLCDAAESFGATYAAAAPAGSFGDASVLSFNGNKIMTTSGGGMLLTDDRALADHVRKLSTQAREPVAHYEHTEVGYNYRLSNILAALGRAQLSRLDEMMARRRDLARAVPARCSPTSRACGSSAAPTTRRTTAGSPPIVVDPASSGWTAAELGEAMAAAGIETRPIWKPMHLQPVFAGLPGIDRRDLGAHLRPRSHPAQRLGADRRSSSRASRRSPTR